MKSNTILVTTPECTVVNATRKDSKWLSTLPQFIITKIDKKTGKVHEFLFNVTGRHGMNVANYDLATIAKNVLADLMFGIIGWGASNGFEFSFQAELTEEQKATRLLAEQQHHSRWANAGGGFGGLRGGFQPQHAGTGPEQTEVTRLTTCLHNVLRASYDSSASPQNFSIRGTGYVGRGYSVTLPLNFGFGLLLTEIMPDDVQHDTYLEIQLAGKKYKAHCEMCNMHAIGSHENALSLVDLDLEDFQSYVTGAIMTFAPFLIQDGTKEGRLVKVNVPKGRAAKKARAK